MKTFKIFTESKADIKFLKDYIAEIFDQELSDDDFDPLGGWTGYKVGGGIIKTISQAYFDNQLQIILILDADSDYATRRAEVIADFEHFEIPCHLFLFPNQNIGGALEDLLCHIAVDNKILSCFDGYVNCIEGYQSPVIKSKIYAYLDALLPAHHKKANSQDLIHDKNRNYRNQLHWNLQHEALEPLRQFLSPFFE